MTEHTNQIPKEAESKSRKKKNADPREMPFLDHLEELRWRLIKCIISIFVTFLIAFPFSEKLVNLLTKPNDDLVAPAELIFLKPAGMLIVRMEVAFAAALIASALVILYQLWQFIAPGLLPKERKYFFPFLSSTLGCFMLGTAFCYVVMIPQVLPFLYNMGTTNVVAKININDYISFVIRLILVTGLVFELPVLSFILSRIGILTPEFLRKYRRYGIVITFIIAALFTPPDPASQVMLALPLIILYEISIGVSAVARKRKLKAEEKEDDNCEQE